MNSASFFRKSLKGLTLGLFVMLLSSTSIPHTAARGPEVLPVLSPTVKIVSYERTVNGDIEAKINGSGTLISENGRILTNSHVIKKNYSEAYDSFAVCVVTMITDEPECRYTAALVTQNDATDIALLQINDLDIYGQARPSFPFLNPDGNQGNTETNSLIQVIGFPSIGGATLTQTTGKISGYENQEGTQQIKTDAVIAPGNSGGTALDEQGNFIGVPTAIRSNQATLGYIVPLFEISAWIAANSNTAPTIDTASQQKLALRLEQKLTLQKEQSYLSPLFPYYSLTIPETWETLYLNDTNLLIRKSVNGEEILIAINLNHFPYDVDPKVLNYVLEKTEKSQYELKNYQRNEKTFKGLSGYEIKLDSDSHRQTTFFAPLENVVLTINYYTPLNAYDEAQAMIDEVLNTMNFTEKANNTPKGLQSYRQDSPTVSMKSTGDFFFSPHYDSQNQDVVVEIENPNQLNLIYYVYQYELSEEYWDQSIAEIFEGELKYRSQNIINQYPEILIDGLPGYAYTYEYQGDYFNQTRRRTVVEVFDGKKYFQFSYDDLAEEHQKNIGALVDLLESFQYTRDTNNDNKGVYTVPSFTTGYQDINEHLYEKQIKALSSRGILENTGANYYPDHLITREEALKAIIASKIFIENGRNSNATSDALSATSSPANVSDVDDERLAQLIEYAMEKGVITRKNQFAPAGPVHVVDALQILCKLYELKVWQPLYSEEVPWYIPYMYKGMTLGVIPERMLYYDQMTKGQFAAMLYDFVRLVGERDDL